MDSIAPMIDTRIKIGTKPWVNKEILELIQARERALRISNKNKANTEWRSEYSRLRNKVNKVIKKAKANHFQEKVEEHKDNSNLLWKQFKTLGYSNKNKEKSRTVLEINNEKCYDNKKVANHHNNFFLTIASILQSTINNVNKVYITTSSIFKIFYSDKGTV